MQNWKVLNIQKEGVMDNHFQLEQLIGSGSQADVYRVGDKAVKVFKEHCFKVEAFLEAASHAMVEKTGLPVPKVYGVTQIGHKMAIVMDFIKGDSLKNLIQGTYVNYSAIDNVIDLHIKIHAIDASFGFPTMKDRLQQKITCSSQLNKKQKEKLIGSLVNLKMGHSLCHGDFHCSNLMMTNQGIMVLDWMNATSGNPEADLCRTYMLYKLYVSQGFADFYLERYCQKTGRETYDIIQWLPIVAGAGLSEQKGTEREQLLEWIEMNLEINNLKRYAG